MAICDDDNIMIEVLEQYIEKMNMRNLEYEVFYSAEELWQYIAKTQKSFDVYLLDIKMEEISGIEIAKKLREKQRKAIFVFLTSYSEYVFDVFDVITFDFLLKPLTYDKFLYTIKKIMNFFYITKRLFCFSYKKSNYSILLENISYIEKNGRKAIIHCVDGKIFQCNMTIDEIWKQLDPQIFVSLHMACIVNMEEIVEIGKDEVTLKNEVSLYMGRMHKKTVRQKHLEYLKRYL